jgi:hypothetical protein
VSPINPDISFASEIVKDTTIVNVVLPAFGRDFAASLRLSTAFRSPS